MFFHSQTNKTHFHKKYCSLGLILRVRVFELGRGLLKGYALPIYFYFLRISNSCKIFSLFFFTILRKLSRGRGLGLPVVRLICFRVRDDNGWFWPCAQSRNLWISFFVNNSRALYLCNCFCPLFLLIFIVLVSWYTTSPWENSRANAKVGYITSALSGPPDKSVSGRTVGSFHEQRLVIKRFAEE